MMMAVLVVVMVHLHLIPQQRFDPNTHMFESSWYIRSPKSRKAKRKTIWSISLELMSNSLSDTAAAANYTRPTRRVGETTYKARLGPSSLVIVNGSNHCKDKCHCITRANVISALIVNGNNHCKDKGQRIKRANVIYALIVNVSHGCLTMLAEPDHVAEPVHRRAWGWMRGHLAEQIHRRDNGSCCWRRCPEIP